MKNKEPNIVYLPGEPYKQCRHYLPCGTCEMLTQQRGVIVKCLKKEEKEIENYAAAYLNTRRTQDQKEQPANPKE